MSDNKKYYWLKLQKTFFSDVKVKMLRKIAGGDTYTIIYLKLLLETIDNNGEFLPEGITDDPIQEIAMTIDETEEDVKVCLGLLEKLKLCEVTDNSILFYEALANTGKETSSARRVREHRAKMLQCNNDVTNCNTELEIDIELKKEKEIDIELKKEKELDKDLEKTESKKNVKFSEEEKKEIIEAYYNSYNSLFEKNILTKEKPYFQYNICIARLNQLAKDLSKDDLITVFKNAVNDKWTVEQGFSFIGILSNNQINKHLNNNKKATEKKSSWKEKEDALLGDWG